MITFDLLSTNVSRYLSEGSRKCLFLYSGGTWKVMVNSFCLPIKTSTPRLSSLLVENLLTISTPSLQKTVTLPHFLVRFLLLCFYIYQVKNDFRSCHLYSMSRRDIFLCEETQVFSEKLGVPQGACRESEHLEVTLLRLVYLLVGSFLGTHAG